jgi:NAD(P)-dependent dehydrogenase (short-subunit alcohol dehydrogenase family)
MELNDLRVLVTGAAASIGRETAKLFARRGATVVVTGRNAERGEQTVAAIVAEGGGATGRLCRTLAGRYPAHGGLSLRVAGAGRCHRRRDARGGATSRGSGNTEPHSMIPNTDKDKPCEQP